jgi:hypothetical protein
VSTAEANEWGALLECPECGAAAGTPCRTPAGRKRQSAHDSRPFTITFQANSPIGAEREQPVILGAQEVEPLAGRAVRLYQCATCGRIFVWHVQRTMPSHVDHATRTWCAATGEALPLEAVK